MLDSGYAAVGAVQWPGCLQYLVAQQRLIVGVIGEETIYGVECLSATAGVEQRRCPACGEEDVARKLHLA